MVDQIEMSTTLQRMRDVWPGHVIVDILKSSINFLLFYVDITAAQWKRDCKIGSLSRKIRFSVSHISQL